jgi:hypothetical protein
VAIARVVSFEGVGPERVAEMQREVGEQGRPEGVPASEIIMLHDPDAQKALVLLFFDSEADYEQADAVLDAMPAGETPGRRAAVQRYDVAVRSTA